MELQDIRSRIDRVDAQILTLFLERMSLADEIAAYKREHRLPIFNQAREREILDRIAEQSGERARYAVPLFTTLMELARTRQEELLSVSDEHNAPDELPEAIRKPNESPETSRKPDEHAETLQKPDEHAETLQKPDKHAEAIRKEAQHEKQR